MTVNEFLVKTMPEAVYLDYGPVQLDERPWVVSNDGFVFSIQAGAIYGCEPREDFLLEYTEVEVIIPTGTIVSNCFSDYNGPMMVYCNVPVELVEKMIFEHGGIKET